MSARGSSEVLIDVSEARRQSALAVSNVLTADWLDVCPSQRVDSVLCGDMRPVADVGDCDRVVHAVLQLRHVAVCDRGAACTHTGSKLLATKTALDKPGSSEVVVKYRLSGHCSCRSVFASAVETSRCERRIA